MLMVFIGGHPRSGTTLLGTMIGSHSRCICTPESQFKIRVLRHSTIREKGYIDIQTAYDLIKNNWRFKIWGINIDSIPYDQISSFPELIIWIVKAYAEKFGRSNANIWVDHTPSNIENFGTLINFFPKAKFIHIVRDGRAVASSIMPLDWGPNTINTAGHAWLRRVLNCLSVESSLGAERIIQVKYEDLIQSPEASLARVCRFLNIDFQPQMIKGSVFTVPQYQIAQHALVGKMPDIGRVKAWERQLTPRYIEIFESIAGDLLLSLGYPLKYGQQAKQMAGTEKLLFNIHEIYRGLITNKIRRRRRIIKGITASIEDNKI